MENFEMLAKKLKNNFSALAIIQLVALGVLLIASRSYPELIPIPSLVFGLLIGGGISVISFLNRGKTDRKEELSTIPYYIFLVVKILDTIVAFLTRGPSFVSLALVVWMVYMIRWIKSYNQEREAGVAELPESEDVPL